MNVIHFTHGATDRLTTFGSKDVYFVPLADGIGQSHVGCAHLDQDATIESPPPNARRRSLGRAWPRHYRDSPAIKPSSGARRHGLRLRQGRTLHHALRE
jgi:hypothetical protein